MHNLSPAISSTTDPWTKKYLSYSLLMESSNITEGRGKVSCNLTHVSTSESFGDGRYFLTKVQHYSTITSTINRLSYGMPFWVLHFFSCFSGSASGLTEFWQIRNNLQQNIFKTIIIQTASYLKQTRSAVLHKVLFTKSFSKHLSTFFYLFLFIPLEKHLF